MSIVRELETHLRTDPDDWETWVVYADWLTDQDDERGQLIRLEHRRRSARLPADEAAAVDAEITDIIDRCKAAWLDRLPSGALVGYEWRHGFLQSVSLRGTRSVEGLVQLLEMPAARLLITVRCSGFDDRWTEPLVKQLPTSGIRSFGIRSADLTPSQLVKLAPALNGLVELELSDSELSWRHVDQLARTGALSELRVLDLQDNELGDRGMTPLTQHGLGALTTLRLAGNSIGAKGAATLVGGALPHLRHLDLGNNDLGAIGAAALAESASLAELERLDLWANGLGHAGAKALATPGGLPALRRLNLASNDLGPRGATEVAGALQPLVELDVRGNQIKDGGLESLCASPALAGLVTLDLGANELHDPGLAHLLRPPMFDRLEVLRLDANPITDRGAKALARGIADRGVMPRLAVLDVCETRLKPAGIAALEALGPRVTVTSRREA